MSFRRRRKRSFAVAGIEQLESRRMLTYTALLETGPTENRVDMVILGDGYTEQQAAQLADDAAEFFHHAFEKSQQPFPRYANFFNVLRIDTVSNESGADKPLEDIYVDTAFDAAYNCFDVERSICVNDARVKEVMSEELGSAFIADTAVVMVNDAQYGGSAREHAVFAAGADDANNIGLHEIGHSFADLADEYWYEDSGTYDGDEPAAANVTTDPTGAKWSHWIGHTEPGVGTIGAYEGGRYFENGIYRPTSESKMKDIRWPFNAVSREQIVLQIYEFVDPLDGWLDNSQTIIGTDVDLWVQPVDTDVLKTEWYVDGVHVSAFDDRQSVNPSDYGFTAPLTITAKTYDPTDWVRIERHNLEQSVTWEIDDGFDVTHPLQSSVSESGSSYEFTVSLRQQPDEDVVLRAASEDETELLVTVPNVTFTAQNWNRPQSIVITGVDDHVADGDVFSRIIVQVDAEVSDARFVNSLEKTFQLRVVDDEVAGLTIAESDGSTVVHEAGLTTDTFTIALSSEPATDVTVGWSNRTGVKLFPSGFSFTAGNWNVPQTVTVTAFDDRFVSADRVTSIVISTTATAEGPYSEGADKVVLATTVDDDIAAIQIETDSLAVAEFGRSAWLEVGLAAPSLTTVVLQVTTDRPGEVALENETVIFERGDVGPHLVRVMGVDDDSLDGDQTARLTVSIVESLSDPLFAGVESHGIDVINVDDEIAGLAVIESESDTKVDATGLTDSVSVFLTRPPESDVVVNVTNSDPARILVDVDSLVFTSSNWSVPQTIHVSAIGDQMPGSDLETAVTFAVDVSQSAPAFAAALAQSVVVTIADEFVSLDIDGDGAYRALEDGVLVLRYLAGFNGESLISGVINTTTAQRTTAADVIAWLDPVKTRLLDVDGDGNNAALTDGLLILRYLAGFRNAPLIANAVGQDATRSTSDEIVQWLGNLTPNGSQNGPIANGPVPGLVWRRFNDPLRFPAKESAFAIANSYIVDPNMSSSAAADSGDRQTWVSGSKSIAVPATSGRVAPLELDQRFELDNFFSNPLFFL